MVFARRRRRIESLIRSAIPEFNVPPIPDKLRAALAEEPWAEAPPVPEPRKRHGRVGRWLAGAVAASALAAALALVLLTRPTTAFAAYARVVAAADAAKTCHIAQWFGVEGEERRTADLWYSDGRFRMQDTSGRFQIYDGERLHVYDPDNNVLFLNASDQPFGTPWTGFSTTSLLQQEGPDAQIETSEVRDAQGRDLTRFVVTHGQLGERLVVLADPATDLPVSIERYVRSASGWALAAGAERIDYDVALDPGLFAPTPPQGAEVIDRDQWGQAWERRYAAGMGRARLGDDEVVIRDLQACAEDDVYVVWTGTKSVVTEYANQATGERTLDLDAELFDNLGTIYLKTFWIQARKDPGVAFTPLVRPASQPRWYVVRLVAREPGGGGTWAKRSAEIRVTDPASSPLSDPIYPPNTGDPRSGFVFPRGWGALSDRAHARAEYWKDHGDPIQALHWYEDEMRVRDRAYAREPTGGPVGTPAEWLTIGSLYEQTGRVDDARRAYQRGLESDRGEDWDPGHRALNAIKDSLRRLR